MKMESTSVVKTEGSGSCCRRTFMKGAMGCGAFTMYALAAGTWETRKAFAAMAQGEAVVETPFARIEKLGEGVWAVISTPLGGDFTTLSNGGIIAGNDGVVVIEGFQTVAGSAWLRSVTEELTGRPPTHVVLTHFHADHSAGLAGYLQGKDDPAIISTVATRDLIVERFAAPEPKVEGASTLATSPQRVLIPETLIVEMSKPTILDLGDRKVSLVPRQGHTPSDISIEVDKPEITWCGDLMFNGLFPNYMDALPSALERHCKNLFSDKKRIFIPGHGDVADSKAIDNYLGLLEDVGRAAREAHAKGIPPEMAYKEYNVPESLGNWFKFRPDIFHAAFEAWARELG